MSLWKKNGELTEYADQILTLIQKHFGNSVSNFVDNKFPSIKNGFLAWRPHVDLKETRNSFVLKADLPGIDKNDLSIDIDDQMLTISGERKSDITHKKDQYHWAERFYGKFSRSFNIPQDVVEPKKIDAKFENGVLTVTLKKKDRKSTIRKPSSTRIQIK